MGVQYAKLELRYIVEKLRNRFSVPERLEGTAWSPKIMDLPPGDRFLVVCPHPDDESVGCGGTLAKLIDAGKDVRVVYLSIQCGDFTREHRRKEIKGALDQLGIKDYMLREEDFPSAEEATSIIREEMEGYGPDAVFVPSPFENHNEHLRAFQSFCEACRSSDGERDVIMYEIWGTLMPNLLIPVSEVMPRKIACIKEHGTQVRDIDYVRVASGIGQYRAAALALDGYAEAFMHMSSNDLLRLFSR